MRIKLAVLVIFFLAIDASAQQVLFICSNSLPCPGFALGSVQAGIDQNGWRNFKLTLTQNVTSFSFVGTPPPAQASATVIFTQDGVGGRTVAFASNISNPCAVASTANATTLCQFEFDGTAGIWIGVSAAAGAAGTNLGAFYTQRASCGILTNCTQIKADGRYIIDATSNSTTTITCPNNDCNFTVADVGKTVWATTSGSGPGVGLYLFTTYVCPVTTIQTINSAQSITVGTACTASGTANVILYWATDDGAVLSGLDSAAGCSTVYLPDAGVAGNYILTSKPFLIVAPNGLTCNQAVTSTVGAPAPALVGTGFGASQTILMIAPNFNWSGCGTIPGASQKVCIGGTARTISNLQVLGSGLTAASNANCANGTNEIVLSSSPASSTMYGVDVGGICPGEAGMIGVELNSFDENFDLGGVQQVGTIAVNVHAASSVVMREDDMHNASVTGGIGVRIENGAQALDIGSYPIVSISVLGKYQTRGTHIGYTSTNGSGAAVNVGATGIYFSYGDYISTDGGTLLGLAPAGIKVASGGSAQLLNTGVTGSPSSISNSGTVIFNGGNTLGALVAGAGTWSGAGVLTGTCRGTATSSATLGLYIMGQTATTACTSTTVNLGLPVTIVPLSGSVFGLSVSAGTGCKSGNTCVFTVLKNGSATTLTCSLVGPASACIDTTHFDIPVAGDTYSIQFTTGATETLANVTATLLAM